MTANRASQEIPASEEAPIYRKVQEQPPPSSLWMITWNEGWRSGVLADGMYEADADFLLSLLGRTPRTTS